MADEQPTAALTAVHRALQVVVVNLRCVGGRLVGIKHGLNLIPDLARHDRFVRALVRRPLVADVALVVRVRENPMHARQPDGLGRPVGRRRRVQAAPHELAVELGGRPLARGEYLERPGHQFGAFGIDLHRADLAATLIADTDVEIPHRCAVDGAALRSLLRQALDRLGGKVA